MTLTAPEPISPAEVADLEAMLAAVGSPDLDGMPVYVVPLGDVPPAMRSGRADGWWSPLLDVVLRDKIGDRYRGRGPCVVVGLPPGVPPSRRAASLAAIGLHELAHAIDGRGPLTADIVDISGVEYRPAAVGRALAEVLDESTAQQLLDSHDVDWVRVALHLCWRAEQAGAVVPASETIGYPVLQIIPRIVDLADEAKVWAGKPLRTLRNDVAPLKLRSCWNVLSGQFLRTADETFRQSANPKG